MNRLSPFAALLAAALVGGLPGSAWPVDSTMNKWSDLPEYDPSTPKVWTDPFAKPPADTENDPPGTDPFTKPPADTENDPPGKAPATPGIWSDLQKQAPASPDEWPKLIEKAPAPESKKSEPPAPTPAPVTAPGWNLPAAPGGYAPAWQPPRWGAPQQGFGRFPQQFPHGGQYPAYPGAPATATVNPLSAELKQAQEQLTAKGSELDEAHGILQELSGRLQDSLATEARLSDKVSYSTRENNALRVRVTELVGTQKTTNATMEQQRQLIDDQQAQNRQLTMERDQQAERLAALQAELQAATKALAQARARANAAVETLISTRRQVGIHRDELSRLEAELQRRESTLKITAGSQVTTEPEVDTDPDVVTGPEVDTEAGVVTEPDVAAEPAQQLP